MSLSTSRLAYTDCYDVFDAALQDTLGVRVKVGSYNEAVRLRVRLHYARNLEREENATLYQPGAPLYGRSIYDTLIVRIKEEDSNHYVYVEQVKSPTEIEGLGGPKPELLIEAEAEEVKVDELPTPKEPPRIEKLRRPSW
jgi:hypothetical protein